MLDGNHLPANEKRLLPLCGLRGAALPAHSQVSYEPDRGLVVDLVACEDAHASERAGVAPLLEGAQLRELWIAAKSRSDLRGTGTTPPAQCCEAWRTRAPASLCTSTPTIPIWLSKASGRTLAAPRRAQCASKRLQLPTPKHRGGAWSSRWTSPPRMATPPCGRGATCPRLSRPDGSPNSTARAGASNAAVRRELTTCSRAWKAC